MLRAILTRLRFDALLERVGIERTMAKIGIQRPIKEILPRLVFYLLLILLARTAADVLGLTAISEAIGSAMSYIPNVIAALSILMIGGAVAQFAGRTVKGAAESAGMQFASSLGSAASGLIIFVLIMMAMAQLEIDTQMVRLVSGALFGGVALGFGLSFGLGSTDVTRGVLAGFYARQLLTVGEEVEVGGVRGRLMAITATQLVLQTDREVVSVPNVALLQNGSRQGVARP